MNRRTLRTEPALHTNCITIRGACQNNLKNIDVDIPLNAVTVITGVSGSGKSSLAFDTIYAEGQRRYIESFSAYARQFMDRMDKPAVASISGILPAIAISQINPVKTSRSTLGTLTEITDYVKLLFPRCAVLHCRNCGRPVTQDSPASISHHLLQEHEGASCMICFPFPFTPSSAVSPETIADGLRRQGFFRIFYDHKVYEVSPDLLISSNGGTLEVLVDQIVLNQANRRRLYESLEIALSFGKGMVHIFFTDNDTPDSFSAALHCPSCDIHYHMPTPALFSFNSPIGACSRCRGFGRTIEVDFDAAIPDKSLSLKEHAIKPWSTPAYRECYEDLLRFCKKRNIDSNRPFDELPAHHQNLILQGDDSFYGVRGFFEWLETKTYKMHIRVLLSKYRAYVPCPACKGTRFTDEALLYRLAGKTIAELYALTIHEATAFIGSLLETQHQDKTVSVLLQEIHRRLSYLLRVGLRYLTLDRQSRTLSGGEVQRASLTTALGSSLVNTLYVLDEPSIGLHSRDTQRLIESIRSLRDMGNTVLIVEHDADIISSSDHVIDLGPRSGENGGQVVFSGTPSQMQECSSSLTGQYLAGHSAIPVPASRRTPHDAAWITVQKARVHNLRDLTTRIPLGVLVCITGVSGSGKSTLLEEVLFHHLARHATTSTCCFFEGTGAPQSVVLMDQSPIGKTPRSNPITYLKAFDAIRKLFARTDLARQRGYTAGTFSFNSSGGRCEQCRGEGFEKIEMQFLADVYIQCSACKGSRYSPEVLEVFWHGKNIRDILDMTVSSAVQFFKGYPDIEKPLRLLEMVGLGYLRLGQPATTLSGGEAQRLKIASFIHRGSRSHTLFLFDEPTTGLHPDDISRLLTTFYYLLSKGHSIIVVEHNLDIIKCADYVIDLGPEGGEDGGRIVVQGTPEAVAQNPVSHTGAFLRTVLQSPRPAQVVSAPPQHEVTDTGTIVIRGAREHNLKNISLDIPRDKMVVITGVSGSGKSTLAFDILYAEGQRRFLETLSPYARQYIGQLQRPDIDILRGLPPAVAIEQLLSRGGRKSTVATVTEIYHYLRLLYAKVGQQHCPSCGQPLISQSPSEIVRDIVKFARGNHCMLLAPQVRGRKGLHKDVIQRARANGYEKIRIDGTLVSLSSIFAVKRYQEHRLELVVAEFPAGAAQYAKIHEAVNRCLALGGGELIALCGTTEKFYSLRAYCPACSLSMPEPDPRLFSFNSKLGACPRCHGMGTCDAGPNDLNPGSSWHPEPQPPEHHPTADTPCPACNGTRLNPAARSVLICGKSIADLVCLTPYELLRFVQSLNQNSRRKEVIRPILQELMPKLEFLEKAGLSYLTLDRSVDTLSGGEAQRIRLAAQVASPLRGVAYILDEPTIGLHPHDNKNLLKLLHDLRDKGNSVIIVEHDEETIRQAEHIIDLGPGGGTNGGRVVAQGALEDILRNPTSLTGSALRSRSLLPARTSRPLAGCQHLTVRGARQHNLRNIEARFPLARLTVVTGVSGSGKTTLVRETLLAAVQQRLGRVWSPPGEHDALLGAEAIKRAVEIDQSPIGSTPRSIPATYVGIYDSIRRLFAGVPEARMRGFSQARFSFNVSGGRCEKCLGQGTVKVAMNFLPDLYVVCDQCHGKRFNDETLQVLLHGKNIAEVLAMTIEEACLFFEAVPAIYKPLSIMNRMGLGYLALGQPSPTLSGGEAQRVKIAAELCGNDHGSTLYILDEPTTGLHISDIPKLMEVLQELVDRGNTVVIIEHNLDVISQADYLIDLGPAGGDRGGRIVAQGSPKDIAFRQHPRSVTARYLRHYYEQTVTNT